MRFAKNEGEAAERLTAPKSRWTHQSDELIPVRDLLGGLDGERLGFAERADGLRVRERARGGRADHGGCEGGRV